MKSEKTEVRIRIIGVDPAVVVSSQHLAQIFDVKSKNISIQIQEPEPPALLEKEFEAVENVLTRLNSVLSDSEEIFPSEVTTMTEVNRTIRHYNLLQKEIGVLADKLDEAVFALEDAQEGLVHEMNDKKQKALKKGLGPKGQSSLLKK